MKRIMTLCFLIVMAVGGAQAQKGMQQVGGELSLATPVSLFQEYTMLGIGIKYQYHFTDNISIEPEFHYYFSNVYYDLSDYQMNYDIHLNWFVSICGLYYFGIPKVCRPYAKLGLSCQQIKEKGYNPRTLSSLGPLFGLGLDIRLAYNLSLQTEIQGSYMTSDHGSENPIIANIGLTYNF